MKTQRSKVDLCRVFQTDLLTVLEVADLLDVTANTVREWLKTDPARLPEPLRFQGGQLHRWPRQQIAAWFLSDCPRNYSHGPAEFVPSAIFKTSDNFKHGKKPEQP